MKGINKIAESPRYKSNEVENDTLILIFDYAKLGLVLKNSLNHGLLGQQERNFILICKLDKNENVYAITIDYDKF